MKEKEKTRRTKLKTIRVDVWNGNSLIAQQSFFSFTRNHIASHTTRGAAYIKYAVHIDFRYNGGGN